MHIINIKVHDYTCHPAMPEMVRGMVELNSGTQGVHLVCCAKRPATAAGGSLHDRLVRDAVRQLRRMPEFRAGADRFTFAAGLLAAS